MLHVNVYCNSADH